MEVKQDCKEFEEADKMNLFELAPWKVLVVGYIVILEVCLLYVNYVARVRYPEYFYETTKIWRKLDRKNAKLSVLAHFVVIMVPTLCFYAIRWGEGLAFTLGFVGTNFIIDLRTVSIKMICLYRECPAQEQTKMCMACIKENAEKYKVGFPSLKVKEVKKK